MKKQPEHNRKNVPPQDTAKAPKSAVSRSMRTRAIVLAALFVLVGFGAVVYNLYQLQIVQHDELAARAENQQLADETITPNRGVIYDSDMKVLDVYKRQVQHFAHGAPAALGHAPAVFVHSGQKPPILAVRGGSAVAFKPAALGKVQQNARKFGLADRFVQRARAQRIDVFQAARFKHLRELFPGGKATAFQQGVNVRTAQRLSLIHIFFP